MLKRILEWDRDTFIYLNNLGIEEYDLFWSIITNISTWIPLFILFFIIVYIKYPKKDAVAVALTIIALVFFVMVATDLTKEFVARLRPNNDTQINTLIRILKTPTSYSFFSGHAASSFSVTTLVVLFLRNRFRWCWLFYIWPLLFATSRIYLGVHYPVDIIVGALVGVFSALIFYNLYIRLIVPYLKLSRP